MSLSRLLACLFWSLSVLPLEAASVVLWDFEDADESPWIRQGSVRFGKTGPGPPEFPNLPNGNQSASFSNDAYLAVADPGMNSHFDFHQDDSVTLEAWVNPSAVKEGRWQYIVGKGRTERVGLPKDNQNWALRLAGVNGEARVNFLFASEGPRDGSHWHRWTSEAGFVPGTGWHHVAVTYTFGQPESIRGWLNGKPTTGVWDMGGATSRAPVVDNDQVRIGNRFAGMLDRVAVHREVLSDAVLSARFQRVGGVRRGPQPSEVMPELGPIPTGRVLFTLSEGLPAYDRWPYESEIWPEQSQQWYGDAFLLPRLPIRYDEWGIRDSWDAPILVTIAADLDVSDIREWLIRSRGLSRLWVNGRLVSRTGAAATLAPNGEESVTPIPEPLFPGARLPGYRQQEVRATALPEMPTPSRVVFELVVGGKGQRTETGEICVAGRAVRAPFQILGQPRVALLNETVQTKLAGIEEDLRKRDDLTRRVASASQNEFWAQRHALAKQWTHRHPPAPIPDVSKETHPIDRFVLQRLDRVRGVSSSQVEVSESPFYRNVLPILRDRCFRCHGEKVRGGLKLDSLERVMMGGESGVAAVVSGNPAGSLLIQKVRETDEDERMPPTGEALSEQEIQHLENWIRDGALWPKRIVPMASFELAPVLDDAAFVRRVYFDTIGIPPSESEVRRFLEEANAGKRQRLIQRLVEDERTADHLISEWLDLLAENPALINQSLNSTGPFRWFLYEALRDHKPMDRLVTELILLRGGQAEGGSAAFGLAAENDAPFAAKAHILASAFQGIELQCARCHDSPYHQTTQRDLYSLAAMLERKSVQVPESSRVPLAFFERPFRKPLIRVSLPPESTITPEWPFGETVGVTTEELLPGIVRRLDDSRERLAGLITTPQNLRFARVLVNRTWKRLIGEGFVEPSHDWEGQTASHPELLDWLAHQWVTHGYDLRYLHRLILTSKVYQGRAVGRVESDPSQRLFNAPRRRRLSAEQLVDAMHYSTGVAMSVEELTFVHDGRRELGVRQTLGRPHRAWMFASLNNERDRPSLSLPHAQTVADVLSAFGWTGSRQKPIHHREAAPNLLQPGILANGVLAQTVTRVSEHSELSRLAAECRSPGELVDSLFLRMLSRYPSEGERKVFTSILAPGFKGRLLQDVPLSRPAPEALPLVTWFNHQRSRANEIQLENERRVRQGPGADPRFEPAWREVYEDVVWSLMNHHEFVWLP